MLELRASAFRGDGGDVRSDIEPNVFDLARLLHDFIDLLSVITLWIKDGFSAVKQ